VPSSTLPPAERHATVAAATALVYLCLLVLLIAGGPLYTEDLWWHLKAGEMYLREGPWPAQDLMLHTARAEAPVQHEWLFGVLLHEIHRFTGFHGLRVAHALAVVLILWLVFRTFRAESRWSALACLAVAAFALLAWYRLFQLRPDLVSIPATILTYRLLLSGDEAPSWRRALVFAVMIAAWANFHSLFLVGLNLLVAALLGLLLQGMLGRFVVADGTAPPGSAERAHRIGAALGLGVVAAALNPRGIEQHLTFLSSSRGAAIWNITDEWSPFHPFDHGANHDSINLAVWLTADAVIVAFLIVAGIAVVRLASRRTPEALEDFDAVRFGLGLAGIVAMLVSIRFLWMSVFPMIYVLRAFARGRRARPDLARAAVWPMAAASLALAIVFTLSYGFANLAARFAADPIDYLTRPYRSHKFHLEGVHFLQRSNVQGNLFNTYWMGGFLGYWLAPRLRTFIDSRTEHYGNDVYMDYSAVLQMLGTTPGETFIDVLERRRVDLFFGVGFPGWWHSVYTTVHLANMPGWLLVSRSYRHAIYLRDDERNRANLERIARYYASEGVPFDRERGLDPGEVIRSRPDWAIAHAMLPPEYRVLRADLNAGAEAKRRVARNALALVYLLNGAYREQIAIDRETASEDATDKVSRRRLVYSWLRLDATGAAQEAAKELLRIDPDDPWSRQLAALARRYAALSETALPAGEERVRRAALNRLLWKAFPATAAETWAVEHAIETEDLPLRE